MHEPSDGPLINPIPPKARGFQGLRAGVVSRSFAGAVDYVVVTAATLGTYVGVVVLMFLIDPREFQLPQWPFGSFLILGFGYMVVYLTVSFATTGRTLGARLMGLRVVGRQGRRMRWGVAFLRADFCAVFPIGLFWCAVSRENRSVQDMVLRTSVIHEWPVGPAIPTPVDPERRRPRA
jgi:uncharacterized RDD family membrane protein YckC